MRPSKSNSSRWPRPHSLTSTRGDDAFDAAPTAGSVNEFNLRTRLSPTPRSAPLCGTPDPRHALRRSCERQAEAEVHIVGAAPVEDLRIAINGCGSGSGCSANCSGSPHQAACHRKVLGCTGVSAACIGRPGSGIISGGPEQLVRGASERGAAPTIVSALM